MEGKSVIRDLPRRVQVRARTRPAKGGTPSSVVMELSVRRQWRPCIRRALRIEMERAGT
jgi:hypothetical protein